MACTTWYPPLQFRADKKSVGTLWVYMIKKDGVYKGQLVVLGWSQVPRIDCGGTFAPMYRLQSIRMVLAIAAELER